MLELVGEAPGVTPVNNGSALNGDTPSELVLPDGVSVTTTILSPTGDAAELESPAVKPTDCDVEARSEGTLNVALEDRLSPGMSSGKHSDPSGIGYEYNVCDHEGSSVSSSSPSSASISRSTAIATSLSSLIPVFKEPAPHTPSSS